MSEVARHTYPDRDTLARSLAELVGDQLRAALASKGRATLAVPGGTTPGPFLRVLSEQELDWGRVTVLLTDERLVSAASDRSNTRLLHGTLLSGAAAAARVVDYLGDRDEALAAIAEALPIDVLVAGMGADGHTASLFPGTPGLAEALAPDAPALVELAPEGQPERRLTLSAGALRGAEVVHLLITGEDKARALAEALEEGPEPEAPVRVVLRAAGPVSVHYAE